VSSCCAISRALIPRLHRGRLWTVLENFGVVENNRPYILSLRFQFYYGLGLGELLGTGEEEQSRSDNQEEEDIDGTGKVEHRVTEQRGCRRYMVVTELCPPCRRERKDDNGVCQGITGDRKSMSGRGIHDSRGETIAYRSIPNAARLCAYSTLRLGFDLWNLFSSSTDQKPSAQKYSGMYSIIEANSAIHSQMYSPPRRSPGN